MKTILLIEDNQEIIDMLIKHFKNTYTILSFKDYSSINIDLNKIHLILLDMNLSNGESGLDLANKLKNSEHKNIPIIMISGNKDPDGIITALKYGINDYICKPLEINYLSYKINNFLALINQSEPKSNTITQENLIIDLTNKTVSISDILTPQLTSKEFDILVVLANNFNEPVSREILLCKINGGFSTTKRTVDTHIVHLRKKLGSNFKIKYDIHKNGYILSNNSEFR